jgi:PAS domain S-box-containing protein
MWFFGVFNKDGEYLILHSSLRKQQYSRLLFHLASLAIAIVGLTVLIGWLLDISTLKSVIPSAVSMKFSTSLSFVCTGIVLYFTIESLSSTGNKLSAAAQIVLPAAILIIILFMSTHLASSILGRNSGIDNLFVKEDPGTPQTSTPGRPSEGTIINFLLISAAGTLTIRQTPFVRKPLLGIGIAVGVIAGIPLIGYMSSIPSLYYAIDGVSNGMAIHTAILFFTAAVTLVILARSKEKIQLHQTAQSKIGRTYAAKISIRTKLTALILTGSVIPTVFLAGIGLNNSLSLQTEKLAASLAILGLATIVSVTIFALLLSKSFLDPLFSLRRAMNEIAEGNFSADISVESTDEIGELARDFRVMKDAIVAANANLEKLVKIRTKELQDANKRLDFMNRQLKSVNENLNRLESKYRKLYDEAPDMYRTENTIGIILDCNQVYVNDLGYADKNEVIGHSIFEHTADRSLEPMRVSFERWRKNGSVRNDEIWLKRKDGTTFPVLISANNLYDDGKLTGSITAIIDETEIYKTRKELELANDQLAKQTKIMSEFINIAAHELKNPITPILIATQLVKQRQSGNNIILSTEEFDLIAQNARRLKRLAEDILDVARIENNVVNLDKQSFNISRLVQEAINDSKSMVKQGVNMTYSGQDTIIEADQEKMQQVVLNLLHNAIKFTQDGTIEVSLTHSHENAEIVVAVSDNGSGIDPDILPRLFGKYVSKSEKGTGLGLYISKNIVEAHGGRIWAANHKTTKGATFAFSLPLSKT